MFQVDLGAAYDVTRIVLRLPAGCETRTQTLTVQGSADGLAFATLAGSAGYVFNPTTGNTVTITVPPARTRYVRLSFASNTGWPAAQLCRIEVYGTP